MLKLLVSRFNRTMESLVDSVRLRLLGPHLLGDIVQVPLRASLDDVLEAYGEPYEQPEDDTLPNVTCYRFEVEDLHLVEVTIWNSEVHQILYTSPRGNGPLDLQTIMDAYGSGEPWVTVEQGYLYRNSDDSVRVWCSAMPLIGVGTKELSQFRLSHRRAEESQENESQQK